MNVKLYIFFSKPSIEFPHMWIKTNFALSFETDKTDVPIKNCASFFHTSQRPSGKKSGEVAVDIFF